MNADAIKTEIAKIVNEFRARIGGKAARKQYAVGKRQITSLSSLGILDYMPAGFGHGDADAVISAAVDAPKQVGGVVNGEGDVTTTSGSDLWKLLNPPTTPKPEVMPEKPADNQVTEPEVTDSLVYKVMKYDNSLSFDRAQRRWQNAPELNYKAAANVAAKFIERGEYWMDIFVGSGTGLMVETISMSSFGAIRIDADLPLTSGERYIVTAMKNALARRTIQNVTNALNDLGEAMEQHA